MVAIRMNYTNFTTDKPVLEQSASAESEFNRDIAIAQLVLMPIITIIGLIWVNCIIRNKDNKHANEEKKRSDEHKEDEKKRFEKKERDKMADIIDSEYNKIVERDIEENLKKWKEKFENIVMFYGREEETDGGVQRDTITGLDVVRFMLHNPNDFPQGDNLLKKLQEDLAAVEKMFLRLRIKLPLRGDCPENIKEELGPFITDVGKIARSFVSAKKRYTISMVLNYFDNVRGGVRSIEDGNDNEKTKRLLPYLKALSLNDYPFLEDLDKKLGLPPTSYNDRGFSFNISDVRGLSLESERREIVSKLQSITNTLCQNVSEALGLRIFADKIKEIWNRQNFQEDEEIIPKPDLGSGEHLRANIIHSLSVFMCKIAEGSGVIQDEGFKELVDDMMDITYVQPSAKQRSRCEMAMRTIRQSLRELEGCKSHLREQVLMAEELERVDKDLKDTIGQALRNQQA